MSIDNGRSFPRWAVGSIIGHSFLQIPLQKPTSYFVQAEFSCGFSQKLASKYLVNKKWDLSKNMANNGVKITFSDYDIFNARAIRSISDSCRISGDTGDRRIKKLYQQSKKNIGRYLGDNRQFS